MVPTNILRRMIHIANLLNQIPLSNGIWHIAEQSGNRADATDLDATSSPEQQTKIQGQPMCYRYSEPHWNSCVACTRK